MPSLYAKLREQSGTTAIEFAIIAPVLALMMMGIVEFAMIMFVTSVMEGATDNSARMGKTGYTAGGLSRDQQIKQSIGARTAGLLNPANITVTAKVYSTFSSSYGAEPCITTPPCPGTPGVNFTDINGNGVWDQDTGVAGYGNPGDIVSYQVSYPWKIMTPIMSAVIGSTINITTHSVVRNEPYSR